MYLHKYTIISAMAVLLLPSCADDKPQKEEPSQIYADEYYAGGKLGTTFNHTASAYEQFAPAVEEQGLVASFKRVILARFPRMLTILDLACVCSIV